MQYFPQIPPQRFLTLNEWKLSEGSVSRYRSISIHIKQGILVLKKTLGHASGGDAARCVAMSLQTAHFDTSWRLTVGAWIGYSLLMTRHPLCDVIGRHRSLNWVKSYVIYLYVGYSKNRQCFLKNSENLVISVIFNRKCGIFASIIYVKLSCALAQYCSCRV